MWRKLVSAVKPHGEQDTTSTLSAQSDVMDKVLEQHPNLSMFHSGTQESAPSSASPPPSPSKSRRLFKRASRLPPRDDDGRSPSPGPPKLSLGIPKKVKSSLSLIGNQSQSSLGRASGRNIFNSAEEDRNRQSLDLLRSPSSPIATFDSVRSSPPDFNFRPSIDTLRNLNFDTDSYSPLTPAGQPQGSVRSILREPNTPGTGRNVRFFSRNVYQAESPDQSTDNEVQAVLPPTPSTGVPDLQHNASLSGVVFRPSSSPKNARPSVVEVFSPLRQESGAVTETASSVQEMDDESNLLDLSQDIQLSGLPPGLEFDLDLGSLALPMSDDDNARDGNIMTSTPYRGSLKAKGKERETDDPVEQIPSDVVDDGIFHSKEKSLKLPSLLHDRSHSFSFGQTAFFSAGDISNRSSRSSVVPSLTSTETKSSPSPISPRSTDSPSQSSIRSRSRALSDTVFHSMLRSSPSTKAPEADINDESSSDLVVYASVKPEPDPFSATANTYYTPQTMIPVTPPKGVPGHERKTSREESIIVSLQTQLALQSELCGQYETDLRARDEMVQILSKKVGDLERDELKRKGILRAWKKRVTELEQTCRYLEDEVEGSRQESMERSIMDEASLAAMQTLHRQISSLDREKSEVSRREDMLREEVQALELLVQERSEEIMNLKETVWNRDESQRELQERMREVQREMEQIGNISMVSMDERYLPGTEEDREKQRVAEAEWEKQRAEMITTMEKTKADNVTLESEIEALQKQLKTNDDAMNVLKNELEAQWGHSEKASERIETLEGEKRALEKERQALSGDVEELQERLGVAEGQKADLEQERQSLTVTIEQLEDRIANFEVDWEESENKRVELEEEKKALEEDMRQIIEDMQQQLQSAKDQVRYKHEHAERIAQTVMERETRIAELEAEHQYSVNEAMRLESSMEERDAEVAKYSTRVIEQEKEIETLCERLNAINREHQRVLGEQERALLAATQHDGETTEQLKNLLERQGEQNVELRTHKDMVNNLQAEVERLRRQVHTLQQESADKEVKIVHLSKKHESAVEDLVGLNQALDSKQMELELVKRRHGVRGTGGSTSSTTNTPAPSRVSRRDSAVFSTPSISRPSSVISNSDRESTGVVTKERKLSSDSITKPTLNTLSKSTRVNGSATGSMGPPSTTKPRLSSTMGAPRMSMGTPTPAARVSSLSRSTSARPASTTSSSAIHRRTSAMAGSTSSSSGPVKAMPSAPTSSPATLVESQEEKENQNIDLSIKEDKRRSMIPTPI